MNTTTRGTQRRRGAVAGLFAMVTIFATGCSIDPANFQILGLLLLLLSAVLPGPIPILPG